jgi:hypothetical protein
MSDYIIPDCPFTKAYAKLAATGCVESAIGTPTGTERRHEQQDQIHAPAVTSAWANPTSPSSGGVPDKDAGRQFARRKINRSYE